MAGTSEGAGGSGKKALGSGSDPDAATFEEFLEPPGARRERYIKTSLFSKGLPAICKGRPNDAKLRRYERFRIQKCRRV